MKFDVAIPPGWIQTPFPPPQRGLYLHAPPGGTRAALLLMDAIAADGTLADQLARAVATGCSGAELLAQAPATAMTTMAELPGLSIVTRVRVRHDGREREELRVFTLIDAGDVRLPIVMVGDLAAAEVYREAVGLVLYTVRPQK